MKKQPKGRDCHSRRKLITRTRNMASIHDLVIHHTRIHHKPWTKPSDIPYDESGHDHSDYTIVMHPWIVDYMMAYRLEPRDIIEGMLFGSRERYMLAARNQLRGCKPIPMHIRATEYKISSLDRTWRFQNYPARESSVARESSAGESSEDSDGSKSLTDSYGN